MGVERTRILTAEVRSIKAWEREPVPLSGLQPEPNFYLSLELEIGIEGQPGADRFHLSVCSISWLEQQTFPYLGQWTIIVDRFDPLNLESFISAKVRAISGASKDELFVKLSRFASWEFDYTFDPHYQRPT
jgi:hypothetical protein